MQQNLTDADIWQGCAASGQALPTAYVDRKIIKNNKISIVFDRSAPKSYADFETCDVEISARTTIHLSPGLPSLYYPERLRGAAAIVHRFMSLYPTVRDVTFSANLGDEGEDNGHLAFSSRFAASTLVPDPDFVLSNAYVAEKKASQRQLGNWSRRKPMAYWRGTDSGVRHYADFRLAPRVLVAALAQENRHILDAGLTAVEPRPNHDECRAYYSARGLLAAFQPPEKMFEYRYQVDIDGNSNAWRGLFLKLISGSPVLKVESQIGYRQWYYDRLLPWVNIVPVQSDASDLLEKIKFLESKPELAESIARQAWDLAASMSYEAELQTAAARVLKHVSGV